MINNKKKYDLPRTYTQYFVCIGNLIITNLTHKYKYPNIAFIKGLKYE